MLYLNRVAVAKSRIAINKVPDPGLNVSIHTLFNVLFGAINGYCIY